MVSALKDNNIFLFEKFLFEAQCNIFLIVGIWQVIYFITQWRNKPIA